MTADEHELEDPQHWDWGSAQKMTPTKEQRVVVSVAFNRDEFRTVAQTAERLGVPVSAFIRAAALDRVAQRSALIPVDWSSGNRGSAHVPNAPPLRTGTATTQKQSTIPELAATT